MDDVTRGMWILGEVWTCGESECNGLGFNNHVGSRTGRVTNARQESDPGRDVHVVAAEIRPTTMAPSKMKSEVVRSGLVIIK